MEEFLLQLKDMATEIWVLISGLTVGQIIGFLLNFLLNSKKFRNYTKQTEITKSNNTLVKQSVTEIKQGYELANTMIEKAKEIQANAKKSVEQCVEIINEFKVLAEKQGEQIAELTKEVHRQAKEIAVMCCKDIELVENGIAKEIMNISESE